MTLIKQINIENSINGVYLERYSYNKYSKKIAMKEIKTIGANTLRSQFKKNTFI